MDFSKLTAYLETLTACGIPAAEMHISLDGKPVYSHIVGYSDIGATKKATPSDTYRVFSCTKVITAVCLMQLVEKGLVELDAPITRYLPDCSSFTIKEGDSIRPAKSAPTICQLLSMTGGFDYNLNVEPVSLVNKTGNATTMQIISALTKSPLQFDPGEGYCYSLCLDVIGAIIEAVSGMRLGQYMQKNIFETLGMKDIGFNDDSLINRLSAYYRFDGGLYRPIPCDEKAGFLISDNFESGGGGLICTASEYAKFAAALSNNGVSADGYRLISRESIDKMRTQHLNEAQQSRFIRTVGKPGYGYGLGVRTLISREISAGRSPLGEFGWDGMGGCYTLIDVENKIGIFFAMHVVGCDYAYQYVHPRLRDFTYEALNK